MRKCLKAMLLFITVIAMLTGCGSKEEVSATDSAKAMFDLLFLGDKTDATSKLGMSDEEATQLMDTYKQSQTTMVKQIFKSSGLEISDEKVEEIYLALVEAFGKLEYTITEKEGSSAETKTVVFETTYLDFEQVTNNIVGRLTEEVADPTNASEVAETFANIFVEELKNATPSTEKAIFESEFSLQKFEIDGKAKDVWFASNPTEFGFNLGMVVTGQK
ncbi:MAG: DUF5105 domain-containing protein [Eubacteriales bacterium]|nr:DUF5105 domain-containing protein [Eubacteriales bacterium]